MKKFSVILALVVAFFFCGKASAENFEVIENENDIVTSIDKDSIKRGTDSKQFPKFNRQDGFSAIVKVDVNINDKEDVDMIFLVSFYEKDGERMYRVLDVFSETNYPPTESDVIQENVDRSGTIWPKVWQYIEKNLK